MHQIPLSGLTAHKTRLQHVPGFIFCSVYLIFVNTRCHGSMAISACGGGATDSSVPLRGMIKKYRFATDSIVRLRRMIKKYKFATDYTDAHGCVLVSMTQINAVILKFIDSTCTEWHTCPTASFRRG